MVGLSLGEGEKFSLRLLLSLLVLFVPILALGTHIVTRGILAREGISEVCHQLVFLLRSTRGTRIRRVPVSYEDLFHETTKGHVTT